MDAIRKGNLDLSSRLKDACVRRSLKAATAESLTGGLISATIVSTSGASEYFDRGFTVYNNEAKQEVLGVSSATLASHTEVSGQCVQEMAQGAIAKSHADLAVAVSGVAGPGPSGGNPAGTVWIGACRRGSAGVSRLFHFEGGRAQVRELTVQQALVALLEMSEGRDPEGFSRC
ncbi:MAG: CinA family protein [Succinivibrio sp.]